MGPSFGPLGLGGGVGCLRPVETTKGRLETLLAERSLTDMINGSAGMRVAYFNSHQKSTVIIGRAADIVSPA